MRAADRSLTSSVTTGSARSRQTGVILRNSLQFASIPPFGEGVPPGPPIGLSWRAHSSTPNTSSSRPSCGSSSFHPGRPGHRGGAGGGGRGRGRGRGGADAAPRGDAGSAQALRPPDRRRPAAHGHGGARARKAQGRGRRGCEAAPDRVEPAPGDVDHPQLHEGRRAAARPDPGGQDGLIRAVEKLTTGWATSSRPTRLGGFARPSRARSPTSRTIRLPVHVAEQVRG